MLTTPLLSFRRAPAVLARDVSLEAFQGEVAAFGATLADPSCVAVSVDGIPVGATRADQPLIPASNQKLLVGAVALEVLGADHRSRPRCAPRRRPAGSIAGDLYLVGGGDPLLTSSTYPVQNDPNPVTDPTSLDALADAVVAAGVQRIDGAVIGDASRYDDEFFAPSWVNDVRGIEAGPYDALLVNDARVTGDPLRAADPSEAAARELTQLLRGPRRRRRRHAGGRRRAGRHAVLASVQSAPMSAVVGEMLATSDNNTAEMLVKELGVAAGAGGTREAGLAVIAEHADGLGHPDGRRRVRRRLGAEQRQPGHVPGVRRRAGPLGPDRSARRRAARRRRVRHAERRSSPTRRSPGGCRPRRARSATPRTTPTRRP